MVSNLKESKHVEIQELLRERKKRRKELLAGKYRVASLLMGLLFCLMGLVFSTVEPIKTCNFEILRFFYG